MKLILPAALHRTKAAIGGFLLFCAVGTAQEVPRAIVWPLEQATKRYEKRLQAHRTEDESGIVITGKFGFAKKVHAGGSRFDGAWLYCYEMAAGGGRSESYHTVTSIADRRGEVLWSRPQRFPGEDDPTAEVFETLYANGLVVPVAPGEEIIALAPMLGRGGAGSIEIWSTGKTPRCLADFSGGAHGHSTRYKAMLYFIDVDHDGRRDIAFNRTVWVSDNRGNHFFNEKCVYRFSGESPRLTRRDLSPEALRSLIARCKRHPKIPHLALEGDFPENTEGEKIFPDEPGNPHDYLETRLPEVIPSEISDSSSIDHRDPSFGQQH